VTRTRKDSNQIANTVLEVIKRNDDNFDLFLKGKLDRHSIVETWLSEELCVRFGVCGDEYDSMLREVNQHGRTTVTF